MTVEKKKKVTRSVSKCLIDMELPSRIFYMWAFQIVVSLSAIVIQVHIHYY